MPESQGWLKVADRHPRQQQGHAGNVAVALARLIGATEHHVSDGFPDDPVARYQCAAAPRSRSSVRINDGATPMAADKGVRVS
ncbi:MULTISPECIES: hypothetical protein [unclassified Paracoccus (in: a-proteobacteria)]|uniref:hypothetical protein n=1 Tax=unclassified Paracoccus (in: a-proteobacteria) TaxID=2688777 RepID=UPI001600FAC9|nr:MULTISPECIES: hypothetical protein [unclassified Paracoccus (in: a-proteobacteria)]MBB1491213.1 hypothetical protein [Paracoccus sp. MC1854]MBB1496973.1 hypothetical protein [Paracoccus sp. MC1862]QQO44613.1 hypothetical protein JGR78_14915 [Paracoccus sp. MC1862]